MSEAWDDAHEQALDERTLEGLMAHNCGAQDEYCAGCHEEEVAALKLQKDDLLDSIRNALLALNSGGAYCPQDEARDAVCKALFDGLRKVGAMTDDMVKPKDVIDNGPSGITDTISFSAKPKCGVTIPEGRSGGVSLCDHERPCPIHALKPKQECTCASTGSHAVFCALAVKRKSPVPTRKDCICGPEGKCDYHRMTDTTTPIEKRKCDCGCHLMPSGDSSCVSCDCHFPS